MPVDYAFKKGIDLPAWEWLNFCQPGPSQTGTSSAYDGTRFIYWAIQYSVAAGPGTTALWRYDTWTDGWQFLASMVSAGAGLDVEWDGERQVLWVGIGGATSWYFFNPSKAAITVAGLTVQPMTFSAAMTPVLPATPGPGSNIVMPASTDLPAVLRNGTAKTGSTTTTLIDPTDVDFQAGHIGSYVRFTSGALAGQARVITAIVDSNTLTLGFALSAAPAVGDSYVIEAPGNGGAGSPLAATGGSTTTVVMTGANWPVNVYRDADVEILAGPGAGQRRRIASNTSDTLTLAASTAGNPRTGPFTTAPTSASTFRIVPSNDFLYFVNGNSAATLYRIDLVATTRSWTALTSAPATLGAGCSGIYAPRIAPFGLFFSRGAGTATMYRYDVGLTTWATLVASWGGEVLNTGGAMVRAPGGIGFFLTIGGTVRMYFYNPATGVLTPFKSAPYAAPSTVEGKRLRFVRTVDGAEYLYYLRGGGQEFFRIPLEWL